MTPKAPFAVLRCAAAGAACALALAAPAQTVVQSIGTVLVAGQAARIGAAVPQGAELRTGADGYLYIKTPDNGFFILRPGSTARLVAYHIDSAEPANSRFKFELNSGVARSVSGDAVKQARQNYRFNTPVAAIGVRGTDFTVFTDQQTTRVAVVSGGVVVSGFGDGCGPEGFGPCEGAARRELFATQSGQVLQMVRGQSAPQLLRDKALMPDAVSPPRADEPAKPTAANTSSVGSAEPSLAPLKAAALERVVVAVETPPVVVPPPVPQLPPLPSPLAWGRWSAVAGQPAAIDQVALRATHTLVGFAGDYAVLRRSDTVWASPKEGAVNFVLSNATASVLNETTGQTTAAALENAKLNINFVSSSFTTQFDLITGAQRFARQASGSVGANGIFGNYSQFAPGQNMLVQGALGSAAGPEAAYVFQSRLDDSRVATGATHWVK